MNFDIKYKENKILLRRSRSLFVPVTLITAGLLCLLGNFLILTTYDFYDFPNSLQSFTASFIGIMLVGLGWFLPKYFRSNYPKWIVFDKKQSQVVFQEGYLKNVLTVPINQISSIEVEVEKKKASASNSARIHANLYHVILVWKNLARWYMVESEDAEEANTLASNLKSLIAECTQTGEIYAVPDKSWKVNKNAESISISWKNNRSLQMAIAFFILNTTLAAFLWWMITRADQVATGVFIILGIVFFVLLGLLGIIGPALYHEATTVHLIRISKGQLKYMEVSRFSRKTKLEKQTLLKDIVQLGYTFSPLDLKMNNRLLAKTKEGNFTIHMPNFHPVQCLTLEHWIKSNLISNR
jgi:hypothetical protein